MKKLSTKIALTIICILALIGILGIGIRFATSLWQMDDDGMFIYGFTLMAITSLIVSTSFISSILTDIWEKKKQKRK